MAADALSAEVRFTAPRPAGLITPEDREAWQKWASEQAQDSFRQGEACWKNGDTAGALGWFERAGRMAPESPTVALFRAMARQACGHVAGAITLLEDLSRQHDIRQVWTLLAGARLVAGRTHEAVTALTHALSHHACDSDTANLADRITAAAGLSGWCGVDDSGAVRIGGIALASTSEARRSLAFSTADGTVLPLRRMDSALARLSKDGEAFWSEHTLQVQLDGASLTGSPLHPKTIMRVEGAVAPDENGLTGWIWHPNNPDHAPLVRLLDATTDTEFLRFLATEPASVVRSDIPLALFRAIAVPWSALPDGPVRVVDAADRDLTGSPIDPGLEDRAARWALYQARETSLGRRGVTDAPPPFLPVPVTAPMRHNPRTPSKPQTDTLIVVPVYGNVARTRACLDSLLDSLPAFSRGSPRVLIVNDASPEIGMKALLADIAQDRRVTLLTNPINRGFVASANIGLRLALDGTLPERTNKRPTAPRDVVLLNSDTLVTGEWLEELRTVAYSAPNIGTVTPLSNDATILSFPEVAGNAIPTLAQTQRLMTLARAANGGMAVDLPTGHGFCLFIRHDCLNETGLFRADLFAQGYGEENDFCLRARQSGWRNVAAPGAYVAHVGSASFGATRDSLLARNLALLNRLHPGYDGLVQDHLHRDPLFAARRRLDLLRWRKESSSGKSRAKATVRKSVILVTHDHGGGVERVVRERCRTLEAEGLRPIIVRPVEGGCRIEGLRPDTHDAKNSQKTTTDPAPGAYPNLRFRLPDEGPTLLRLLMADPTSHVEWHHASGHHMAMRELAAELGVPYDVYVHDYIWFCPRIALMGVEGRYCGEPPVAECERCVTALGRNVDDDLPVADYVARSRRELADARRIIVPSNDAAQRMKRHFPRLSFRVAELEDDRPDLDLSQFAALTPRSAPLIGLPRTPGRARICVVGAIGREKGYDVLLAAARDAQARNLPLEYVIVGHTPDDAALMATGHVHVTGAYREHEAVALIRAQQADYSFIPSVWPETWCLALGVAWRAGLPVAAFDLGAVAERIRRTGRGHILPLGVSLQRLNVILTTLCQRPGPKSA
ncbi:glycosyltransferase [Acetobacter estunensis]|uniref:glycosyltransferase n=1 Tax=Acetobacter estunensis TaxID=104097 RepID=UPI001C2D3F06|nr:glycosyltransferase [Acetobacter estunensis]